MAIVLPAISSLLYNKQQQPHQENHQPTVAQKYWPCFAFVQIQQLTKATCQANKKVAKSLKRGEKLVKAV